MRLTIPPHRTPPMNIFWGIGIGHSLIVCDVAGAKSHLMQSNKNSYAPILHEAHVIPLTHYYFQSFRSQRFVFLMSSLVRPRSCSKTQSDMCELCAQSTRSSGPVMGTCLLRQWVCFGAGQWGDTMGYVNVLLWRSASPMTKILGVHSCHVMGKHRFWSSGVLGCISRHGMGKDWGRWVLSTTAGLCPVPKTACLESRAQLQWNTH